MKHLIQPTREQGGIKRISYLPGVGSRKTQIIVAMHRKRKEDDFKVASFRATMLAAYTHLSSKVILPKCFLSHLIMTLS